MKLAEIAINETVHAHPIALRVDSQRRIYLDMEAEVLPEAPGRIKVQRRPAPYQWRVDTRPAEGWFWRPNDTPRENEVLVTDVIRD